MALVGDPPDSMLLLRLAGTAVLGLGAAWLLDRRCQLKGLLPPGFKTAWRRGLALAILGVILWIGVFLPLAEIGIEREVDLAKASIPQLFALQALMAVALAAWFLLGYAGVAREAGETAAGDAGSAGSESERPLRPSWVRQVAAQLGFRAASVWRELGLGVLLGVGAWGAVLLTLVCIVALLWLVGGEGALPKSPPAVVPWIAGLPVGVRLLVSLSAGVVEETFFRGFLQPRLGIVLSTCMFALAHVGYGQPLLVVGVFILALIYALLVRWRQTVWPAIAAHALFDGIQLLVIIPWALKLVR